MIASSHRHSHDFPGNLYGTLFYKLKIRKLTIEDTPLEKIDDLLFRGVNRTLQELYIVNSNLKEFPKNAFKVSLASVSLKCSSSDALIVFADSRQFNNTENRSSRHSRIG